MQAGTLTTHCPLTAGANTRVKPRCGRLFALAIAVFVRNSGEVGLKVKDQEMKELNFERRRICPQWNYVFQPRHLSSA